MHVTQTHRTGDFITYQNDNGIEIRIKACLANHVYLNPGYYISTCANSELCKRRFPSAKAAAVSAFTHGLGWQSQIDLPLGYGTKRDYPKIDIFYAGKYQTSTTWSRNQREAKIAFWLKNKKLTLSKISTEKGV